VQPEILEQVRLQRIRHLGSNSCVDSLHLVSNNGTNPSTIQLEPERKVMEAGALSAAAERPRTLEVEGGLEVDLAIGRVRRKGASGQRVGDAKKP